MRAANMASNQYGRTSFLFAGVPGMQLPVSFWKDTSNAKAAYSIYEQVLQHEHLQPVPPDGQRGGHATAMPGRYYKARFLPHAPDEQPQRVGPPHVRRRHPRQDAVAQRVPDAVHVRPGRQRRPALPDREVQRRLRRGQPGEALPFHNNTCDGCHVRNGSGVPINTPARWTPCCRRVHDGTATYNPTVNEGLHLHRGDPSDEAGLLRPAAQQRPHGRLALFGAACVHPAHARCSRRARYRSTDLYYNNTIMNFYGDSFHVTTPGNSYSGPMDRPAPKAWSWGRSARTPSSTRFTRPWQVKRRDHSRPARTARSSCRRRPASPGRRRATT